MAKDTVVFPSFRRGDKSTKPGTQPNKRGEKLVNVLRLSDNKVVRIPYGIAERYVSAGAAKFVSKKFKN